LGVVDVIALAGLWVWALWDRNTRRWTTVVTLLTVTATYVALSMVPGVAFVIARVAVLGGTACILLFRAEWFMARTEVDLKFDQSYCLAQRDLQELAQRRLAGEVNDEEFAVGISELIKVHEQMQPPDQEWAGLRNDTIEALRGLISAEDLTSQSPPQPGIDELRSRYKSIRHDRTRPWGRARLVRPNE
jgi:hypothetical protein